jgi:hypothetical protein
VDPRSCRILLAACIFAVAAVATPQVAALGSKRAVERALGAFHAECTPSHELPDDPIVFPGRAGASHLHVFFGNRRTHADTTSGALHRFRGSSCIRDDEAKGAPGPADSSGYWVPAVYVGDHELPATTMGAYYTSGPRNYRKIRSFPPKLRMIAGDSAGQAPQQIGAIRTYLWRCGGETVVPATRYTAPTCAAPDLRLDVLFPDCWDGKHIDSRDHKSHMAYSRPAGSRWECPQSHPVLVPVLKLGLRYHSTGGPRVKLASGPISTSHGDFMNGWSRPELRKLVNRCLKRNKYCGGGDHPAH